jgi:hypothetical protein
MKINFFLLNPKWLNIVIQLESDGIITIGIANLDLDENNAPGKNRMIHIQILLSFGSNKFLVIKYLRLLE